MRTLKLPVGRPLPVGRAPIAGGALAGGRGSTAGRSVAALAAVAAVLAASACAASSAATGPTAARAPAAAGASATGAGASAPVSGVKAGAPVSAAPASPGSVGTGSASCPTAAWASEVTSEGKIVWTVSLPVPAGDDLRYGLQPVVSGDRVIVAEGSSVDALRLSDGHLLWRHVFPQARGSITGTVSFLYGYGGEVIALVGQVSPASRLVALNDATGKVAWTRSLGKYAVLGSPVVAAGGVLAFLTPKGGLDAVSLRTGTPLWSRGYGAGYGNPRLVAVGTRVIAAKDPDLAAADGGSVAAFSAQTGKVLWTRTGMSRQPTLLATSGSVLVYDQSQNVYPTPVLFPVTELNPATGKTQWRIPTAGPVDAVWWSPGALTIATTGRTPRLYAADPVAHRVRWSAAVSADFDTAPLAAAGQLIYAKSAANPDTLVSRGAASGQVRWSLRVPAEPHYLVAMGGGTTLASYYTVTAPGKVGALVISKTGKVIAKIALPTAAQAPPAVAAGGDTVLQLDTPQCGVAFAGGAAVTGAAAGASAAGTAVGTAG
ncbi:MAG TPA: PQQ-binding-like beta-propeller repeat protein [Trebonia sp.]|nr:PQQ-binding-like beta-propeller repeat protein [Trebonia sp.]